MYRAALIVMLVQNVTVFNAIVVIIANFARGFKIAPIMKTWKELQLVIASQEPEARTQHYFNVWLQLCSLFAASSVAGAFLWVSRFFMDIMMSSDDKKRFITALGPWMVRQIQ